MVMASLSRLSRSTVSTTSAASDDAVEPRAPRVVHRYVDGELTEPTIDQVVKGLSLIHI